jgi:hypothetical protein
MFRGKWNYRYKKVLRKYVGVSWIRTVKYYKMLEGISVTFATYLVLILC